MSSHDEIIARLQAKECPRDAEIEGGLLRLALSMCETAGERGQDPRLSREERREALCEGFRQLLVVHMHGIAFPDEEGGQ